jgi:hypothetical protein
LTRTSIKKELGLPRKTFDSEALLRAADALREIVLSHSYLDKQKRAALDHIDHLVNSNKNNFKYVVDGMNVFMDSKKSDNRQRVANLHKLLRLLNDQTCLVILREHVRIKPSEFKCFQNVEFVFLNHHLEDDKFMLYAAMKSNLRLTTHLISNDYFGNNLPQNEHGYAIKWWLMHQRVMFDSSRQKLFPQPYCFIRVQPIPGDLKRWLVPCVELTDVGSEFIDFHILEENKNY